MQKAGDFAGVESIGTHTMRKTFGYWFYKQTKDVAMLQDILNHSTPQITLKYIGINKEEKDHVLDTFYTLIQTDDFNLYKIISSYIMKINLKFRFSGNSLYKVKETRC